MFRYLIMPDHSMTISEPIDIPGSNNAQEIGGNLSMH